MTGTMFGLAVVNGLIIFLANRIFPSQIVLGTACISKIWAVIYSGVALWLINMLLMPWAGKIKDKRMMTGFLVNVLAVWLAGRLANNLGMGIASWRVAVVMGAVLTLAQRAVSRKIGEFVKK